MNWWLWGILFYAFAGIVTGLIVANDYYSDDTDRNKDEHAFVAFIVTFFIWPLVVIGVSGYWIVRGGAWLLPAYRREQRGIYEKKEQLALKMHQTENETMRRQVDELHQKMGIAKVDWSGKI